MVADSTKRLFADIFTRLGQMRDAADAGTFGYHAGFAVLVLLVGAIDVVLRLYIDPAAAGMLQLALYAGFTGGALAVIVAYGCLLIDVIGAPLDTSRGPRAGSVRTALLGSLLVVPPTLAGLCCCVLPGVAVACMLAPVPVLVVLRRYAIRDAVGRAVDLAGAYPLTLLPVWLIVTTALLAPLLFDGLSILVVSTAIDPAAWLYGIGPAVRWLAAGTFGLAAIWALVAAVPVLDDRSSSDPRHRGGTAPERDATDRDHRQQ